MKTFLQRVALGVAFVGLAGCNSLTGDALDTLNVAVFGPESQISIAQVEAIDAPVLLANLGVAEALLVSPGRGVGLSEWHGRTEMLLTHHGRLVQTAGLPVDVIAPLVADDPFMTGLHAVADGQEVTRLMDYPAQYRTGLPQHARYKRGKVETVNFMGQDHQLLRVDEYIRMPELDFRARNQYWVEPDTGLVRRSIQHFSPELPPLILTLAKVERGTP